MTIKYRKLRDGSWGVAGPASEVEAGKRVTVGKSDGTTKVETIGKVIAGPFDDGNVLATVVKTGKTGGSNSSGGGRRGRSGGRVECDECGEYVSPGTRCWETGMTH